MAKIIKTGAKAKEAIKAGVDTVANVAKATLGPTGKAAILDRGFGSPTITDDGVTVAKDIELEDKFENVGASLIKEVANKTNDEAGDGTTTAIVLAQKMIESGIQAAVIAPARAHDIKKGMDKAVGYVVEMLQKVKKDVKTREEIAQVATISSLDPEVGKLISEIMEEVGHEGVVTVEEGQSIGLEKEVVKGMRFDKGYVSGYMVTNTERMEAELNDPYILITDQKVSALSDILPLLEKVIQSGKKEIVLVADDIEGEALATFVLNKIRGTFTVLGVKAPGFGDRRKDMLRDIAVLTGGTVITEEIGLKLDKAEVEHLGRARKVVSDKENTTIVDGMGAKETIEARIAEIRRAIADATSDFDKEKLQERLAKLVGGVGVIRVGAFTETEMKAKKYKIEDALNATRAAIEEGIVAGGGASLAAIAPKLDSFTKEMPNDGQKAGVKVVRTALEAPLRQLAENSGIEPTGIISYVQTSSHPHAGFDFSRDVGDWEEGKVEDMLKAGIVDPLKVTRLALENAVSIASTLITSEAVVVDKPEKKEPMGTGAGMGGMGGMDMGM